MALDDVFERVDRDLDLALDEAEQLLAIRHEDPNARKVTELFACSFIQNALARELSLLHDAGVIGRYWMPTVHVVHGRYCVHHRYVVVP